MSEAKHTQDTLIVLPPSAGVDANWHVTDKGDTFVAHVFGFGHAVDAQSEANARRIAACWNACEGLDTGLLKNITTLGDTLASRFRMRDKVERDLQAQRDELLAALKGMLEVFGDEFGMGDSSVCDDARAAIAKAEGQ